MCAAAADRLTNFFQKCVPQPPTDVRISSKNVCRSRRRTYEFQIFKKSNFQKVGTSNFSKISRKQNFIFVLMIDVRMYVCTYVQTYVCMYVRMVPFWYRTYAVRTVRMTSPIWKIVEVAAFWLAEPVEDLPKLGAF